MVILQLIYIYYVEYIYKNMQIPYWFDSPSVIFDKNDILDVIPDNFIPTSKNINSILRLSIYFSIVFYVLFYNKCFLFTPLLIMIITYIWYIIDKKTKNNNKTKNNKKENFENDIKRENISTMPTNNNPFMNFNYTTDSCRKKPSYKAFVCENDENEKVKEDIESKFDIRLYKDTSDIFNRRNSQREFYTRAYDCVPDQTSFSKWCFKTGPTCKEQGVYCAEPSL